jgi:hypothetical protein
MGVVNFTSPAAMPPGKSPCTDSVVSRIDAGKGPSPGNEFEIFDAVLPHSAMLGGIWNVQTAGHFPLRLTPAQHS